MKKLSLILAALALIGGTFAVTRSLDAQEPSPEMSQEEAMQLMMKWMELCQPGPEHAELMKSAGKWDIVMKYKMDPSQPEWTESTGTSRIQKTLGDRMLVEKYSVPADFGSMDAVMFLGYDRLTEEYYSVYMGNWQTAPSVARGKKGEDGIINMHGTMTDLITPNGRPMRVSSQEIDADHTIVKIYDTIPPQGEVQVVEMHYSRQIESSDAH